VAECGAAAGGGDQAGTYLSLLTMHGTIMVFFVLTTGAAGRVREITFYRFKLVR